MIPDWAIEALAETAPLAYDPDQQEVYCVYCQAFERYQYHPDREYAISMSRLTHPYAHPEGCPWRELCDTRSVNSA